MARADITTPDGFRVQVTDTPEEVAKILQEARKRALPGRASKATRHRVSGKTGLPSLLELLRNERFFKEKRRIGEIAARLGEMGSHYSGTTLGKQLLREVRARRLRRLKDGRNWTYVQ